MTEACVTVQDEVDDLIQDEAEELPDAQDARQLYRAGRRQRQQNEPTAEELEAYVNERFWQPSHEREPGDGDAGQELGYHDMPFGALPGQTAYPSRC